MTPLNFAAVFELTRAGIVGPRLARDPGAAAYDPWRRHGCRLRAPPRQKSAAHTRFAPSWAGGTTRHRGGTAGADCRDQPTRQHRPDRHHSRGPDVPGVGSEQRAAGLPGRAPHAQVSQASQRDHALPWMLLVTGVEGRRGFTRRWCARKLALPASMIKKTTTASPSGMSQPARLTGADRNQTFMTGR